MVPSRSESLTTATRLVEFMSGHHAFSVLGVSDVWLSSDGYGIFRLEINIQGWGVYQSVTLSEKSAPWLQAPRAGGEFDLRAAAEHIYGIVARLVESVGADAEEYLYDAIATYRVEVSRPEGVTTLLAGPRPKDALVTAMGALSMAAAELGLDYVPTEARHRLEEHGVCGVGPLTVTIRYRATVDPAPTLRRRPVVAALDRFLG
ncbi:hypothetical protein [Streptomyces sp. S.PB5]|uniref:hypothetical protein n=1 Tax=Streptomyces sp. S.PB5 TaxID=3020844 RepID=UPI0025AFDD6E|nr:hypothetical protein [Streptomyces sp. S.PB5]MDN3026028.1 hypothetical protein [Streptomyces sp. S.PB5]